MCQVLGEPWWTATVSVHTKGRNELDPAESLSIFPHSLISQIVTTDLEHPDFFQ